MDTISFIAVYVLIGIITFCYFMYLAKNKDEMTLEYKIKMFLISLVASPLVILLELFVLILNRFSER